MNAKILTVCFFAAILILAPISSVSSQSVLENKGLNDGYNKKDIKIPISEGESQNLYENDYEDIVDYVLTENNEIEMKKLAEVIDINRYLYGNDSFYNDIINLFLDAIFDRLGWVYDGVTKAMALVNDGRALYNDIKSIPNLAEKIKETYQLAEEVVSLLLHLIKFEWAEFFAEWEFGIIYNDLVTIYNNLNSIYAQIQRTIDDVERFIADLEDFINWYNSKPWNDDIRVFGYVQNNNQGITDVLITSRGNSTYTNEEGRFDFNVSSEPGPDSFPNNPDFAKYGVHNCTITAEKGDEKKKSLTLLSYSFGGGTIEYDFNDFGDGKEKVKKYKPNLIEEFFERFFQFFYFF